MSARKDAAHQLLIEGQMALEQGNALQARTLFKKSLEKSPSFDAAFLTGLTYGQQNNLKMASNYLRQATQIDPGIAEGHFNYGYALQLQKIYEPARAAYLAALNIKPDYHAALHNLGVVLDELGQFHEAIDRYQDALKLVPDAEETLNSLGWVLIKVGRNADALAALNRALELAPNHLKAITNRGLVYVAMQRFREAMEDYSTAIALDPTDPDLRFNLGQAASHRKLLDEAIAAYTKTIELKPDHAQAWVNRAFELEKLKRHEEALIGFDQYKKLKPDAPFATGFSLMARMNLCDWRDYDASATAILTGIENGKPAMVPHAITLLPSKRIHQRQAAELWAKGYFSTLKSLPFEKTLKSDTGRIRIAYFSTDFQDHPVGILTARLFEMHDRTKFEIFAFSLGIPTRDKTRLRIEAAVDHFINARDMSDADIVQRARQDGIDIAVDLNGYTSDCRSEIFALRAAPVQVNYLGYSATMGADFMDYIIGDPVVIPQDHDVDYSEKVVRLPDCYMPGDPTRDISQKNMSRQDYGLPEQGFVFCAFNNPAKIAPSQFDLWMQILVGAPDSVLWMSSTASKAIENLRREAQSRGVEPNRLIFAKREDNLADHLARHSLAGVFLDTLPHNAHATANDALCAGLPVLTRLGETFAGRVAGSLVSAAGMPDMIAENGEDYVRRAIEIATTPGLSAQLKSRLEAHKKTSALFDTESYARKIERAYSLMHECRMQGLPASVIEIE